MQEFGTITLLPFEAVLDSKLMEIIQQRRAEFSHIIIEEIHSVFLAWDYREVMPSMFRLSRYAKSK
jgi:hypothetical protein